MTCVRSVLPPWRSMQRTYVRDGKKSRRTPFKMENSLTPTLTPAVRQLRKRPSSKEDIVAILVERAIEHNPLGNFQDLCRSQEADSN